VTSPTRPKGRAFCPKCGRKYIVPEEELQRRPGVRFRGMCHACDTPFSVVWRDETLVTEAEEVLEADDDGRDILIRGTRIGKYEIEELLDSGGSSSVYKAFEAGANRYVALKVLHRPADSEFGARFRREVEVQGNLKHPNLMPIFDHGVMDGKPFYTMELLHKPTTLETIGSLFRAGRLGFNPALRSLNSLAALVRHVILPVTRAMDFANAAHGIVHRDLKPDNVIVDARTLRVYVIDFGICHTFGPASGGRLMVRAGKEPVPPESSKTLAMGAVRYMPPEQARGEVSRQGDIWAIGALLRFLITGDAPISPALDLQRVTLDKRIHNLGRIAASCRASGDVDEAAFYESRLAELRAGEIRSMRDVLRDAQEGHYLPLPPTVEPAVAAILDRAMAKESGDRYPAARDLAADLQAWLEGRPVRAYTAAIGSFAAAAHRSRLFLRRHRTAVLAVGTVLFLALASLLVFWAGSATREIREIDAWIREAREEPDPWAQQTILQNVLARRPEHQEANRLYAAARSFATLLAKIEDARRVRDLMETLQRQGKADDREDLAADTAAVLERGVLPDLDALPKDYPGREIRDEVVRLAGFLRGRRILSVSLAPRGVEVVLVPRRTRDEPELDWGAAESWGTSPMVAGERFLDPGSYVVVFRRDHEAGEVCLPVRIARSTPPRLEVRCPMDPSRLPEGMRFVAGGEGLPLGDPRFTEATRRADLSDFLIDRTEVTNQQYARYVDALEPSQRRAAVPRRLLPGPGAATQPLWSEDDTGRWAYPDGAGDHPVTNVSFNDARSYAAWADKRLPTAAEWERAARGVDEREYPFGRTLDLKACNADTGSIAPVATYPGDRSPFGIFDLGGNVAEWTENESSSGMASVKGGSFDLPRFHAIAASSTERRADLPYADVGFRCARSLGE